MNDSLSDSKVNSRNAPLMRYAFLYVLGPIEGVNYTPYTIQDYGNRALTLFRNKFDSVRLFRGLIALDWIWDLLTEEDKITAWNYAKEI